MHEARSVHLGQRRWPDLEEAGGLVLLVPVGSCEQHGPHLPLDTDTRIAVAIAEAVAARRADVVVAPPVAIGASGEHAAFPGTLSIGTEVLESVLVEVGRSALPAPGGSFDRPNDRPFDRVVYVNGHGGNAAAVAAAVTTLVAEGRDVEAWWPTVVGGDAHAGRTETSLLLAIDPAAVGAARPVGETAPLVDLEARLRASGVRAVSDSGVLGDATGASAAEGRRLLERLVADLHARVDGEVRET